MIPGVDCSHGHQTEEKAACPYCKKQVRAYAFPAHYRGPETGRTGEAALVDNESSCFYHPNKKASVPCDHCGRFLCDLCDISLEAEHVCPQCLSAGRRKESVKSLLNHRILYGNIALSFAVLPMLIWPVTLITAPIALFIAVRYCKAPGSLVRPSKGPHVIAVLLALIQMAGWAVFLITAFVPFFLSGSGGQ